MRWSEIVEDERWDSASRQWVSDPEPQKQTVKVNGVLRPLYNSENGLIAPTPEAQIAFWTWFGKSKVIDGHGRPLVAHRGDKLGKTVFTGRERPSNYIQGNIFFTSERSIAAGYTPHRSNSYLDPKNMNQSHGLYSVYLKIEKPVIVDAKGEDWSRIPLSGRLKKAIGSDGLQIDDLALYVQQNTQADGLIVKNVWDQFGDSHQFVVFSGQQIKLLLVMAR
jgi:ADP-Ribosyltransferase in polyvalent proteins